MRVILIRLACFAFFLTVCGSNISVVAATITPVGKRISIAVRPVRQVAPAAAFDPITRNFLVTWVIDVSPGEGLSQKLRGRFVKPNGSITPRKALRIQTIHL
jgi:hypothetical protein